MLNETVGPISLDSNWDKNHIIIVTFWMIAQYYNKKSETIQRLWKNTKEDVKKNETQQTRATQHDSVVHESPLDRNCGSQQFYIAYQIFNIYRINQMHKNVLVFDLMETSLHLWFC